MRFGPDGLLHLALGSTCNVCMETDERRTTIMRFQADGSGAEIIASGHAWSPPVETAAVSQLDSEAPDWLAGANLPAMVKRGSSLYAFHGCRSCHKEGENPKVLSMLNFQIGYEAVI